jgi:hypothetical protein
MLYHLADWEIGCALQQQTRCEGCREERELSNEAKGAWVCPAWEDPAKCHQLPATLPDHMRPSTNIYHNWFYIRTLTSTFSRILALSLVVDEISMT